MLTAPPPRGGLHADRTPPDRAPTHHASTGRAVPPAADPDSLRRFHAFHAILQVIVAALRAGNWTALVAEPGPGPLEPQLVQAVRTRLMAEIPPPASDGAATPDLEPGQVMALIADETLLHDLVWPGQQGWAREPLQTLLYGATGDSEQIVEAIEAVAKGDPAASDDVAQTIRLALDLGYLDRPAGTSSAVAPAPTSPPPRRLFEIVFRPADPMPAVVDDFMAGAVKPLSGLPVMQLPSRRPWLLALAALLCAWLLVSLALWWLQTGSVVSVATSLLASLHPPTSLPPSK
jgi:hypothetical protein